MIRSFALTCSIILNRFVAVTVFLVLQPQQNTTFAGNETWFIQVTAGITGWLSWTKTYPADRDTPRLDSVSAVANLQPWCGPKTAAHSRSIQTRAPSRSAAPHSALPFGKPQGPEAPRIMITGSSRRRRTAP